MIQLHRLEGFYWVAKCGGYAKAARAFPYPITQPGVHQQVRKLEADLGQTLFVRVAVDEVRPTPAGRKLFEFCAPFFEQLPRVVRSIEAQDYGGTLRIDGVGLTVRGILPQWVRRIRERRPDIEVHLEEVTRPDLGRLEQGVADILVDFLPDVPEGVATHPVGTAYTFLVMPSNHPHAKRKRVSVRDMAETPFVSYPPDTTHHRLQMQALAEFDVEPPQVLSAPTVDSILAFVHAGLGYSLVPWLTASGPRQAGVVSTRVRGDGAEFPIVAAWIAGDYANPLVDAALELVPS